jgi:hypothetical protein
MEILQIYIYIYMTHIYTCYRNTVKRESEKCQNKHSVAIAGIDLCHIYIFVIHTQQDATHRNKKDGNISLKWISDEIRCVWLRIWPVEASCERVNEAIVLHKMAELSRVAWR